MFRSINLVRALAYAILAILAAVGLFLATRPAEAVAETSNGEARTPFLLMSGVESLYFPEGTQSVGLLVILPQAFPNMGYTFTLSANSQNCELPLGVHAPFNAAGLPEFDFGRMSTSEISLLAALDSPAGPGGAYYCVEWQAMSQGVRVIQ